MCVQLGRGRSDTSTDACSVVQDAVGIFSTPLHIIFADEGQYTPSNHSEGLPLELIV